MDWHFKDAQTPLRDFESTLQGLSSTEARHRLTKPANTNDSLFCLQLGQNAVQAGMSGRTNMLIG